MAGPWGAGLAHYCRAAALLDTDFRWPFRIAELEGDYLQIKEIGDGGDQTFAELAQAAVTQAEARDEPALIIDLRRCLGGDGTLNERLVNALAESDFPQMGGRPDSTHRSGYPLRRRDAGVRAGAAHGCTTHRSGDGRSAQSLRRDEYLVTPNSALPIIHASDYYQTSTPDDQRRFRAPDIAISYIFADYEAGTDAVLETALNLINGDDMSFRPLMLGVAAGVVSIAASVQASSPWTYHKSDDEIGRIYYYERTNTDGSMDERVTVFRRDATHIEVYKENGLCRRAALVTAELDQAPLGAGDHGDVLEIDAQHVDFAFLELNPETGKVESVRMPDMEVRDDVKIESANWTLLASTWPT